MLLSQLSQQNWLRQFALWLWPSFEECQRLRVKEFDFDFKQIVIRDAKGEKSRVTEWRWQFVHLAAQRSHAK